MPDLAARRRDLFRAWDQAVQYWAIHQTPAAEQAMDEALSALGDFDWANPGVRTRTQDEQDTELQAQLR